MNAVAESIPEVFRRVVRQHAARTAIATPAGDWTYAELAQRVNAVAQLVRERAADPAQPVALLLDHGAPLIASLLGVLQAGRIYVSLDPHHPPDRHAAVLAAATPGLLLCDVANAGRAQVLARAALSVVTVPDAALAADESSPVSPDLPAWLMFTSGSTGVPKGVWQSHASVIHHAQVYAGLIQLQPADRLSLLTSTSLAASATHLFAALLNGAALAPLALRTEGVERAARWLRAQRISVAHTVPTIFRQLARVAEGAPNFETVRLLRLGGEALLRADVELFQRVCPDQGRLLHALSSTETGLVCAQLLDKHSPLPDVRVPVGRPVRGVTVTLVDDQGAPVPAGQEGRLLIGSEHLQHGYWRRPELDAERFRVDPTHPARRIFVSNDLGRWRTDGALEHLGRTDLLVKLGGARVDLAEVEAALLATELVTAAAAQVVEDAAGERRLVAYYVPRADQVVSAAALRRALAPLPQILLPAGFVSLAQLPLTTSGKVDRLALPAWSPPVAGADGEFLPPRKGIESTLAEIWQEVLAVPRVGRRDDFFDLGGGSLHSAQLLRRIQERFDLALSPSTLVQHSTIEALAELVSGQTFQTATGPLIVLRETGAGRPLFLVHGAEGDLALYGQLIRRLPPRRIYGFQCPGLNGECDPVMGIPELARLYLPQVLARDPDGPYLLGGTRMGAWVAFEMAQQLVRQGKSVGLVAMLNFYLSRRRRLIDPAVFAFTRFRDRLRVRAWSARRARAAAGKPHWLTDYRQFIAKMNCHARHDYRLEFYPGAITVFVTPERVMPPEQLAQCARAARVVPVPGRWEALLAAPAVEIVARELAECLRVAENQASARAA